MIREISTFIHNAFFCTNVLPLNPYEKSYKKLKEVFMGKNIKKRISLLLTFCMLVACLSGIGKLEAMADSTSWNFKNSGFKDLGTISSTVTVDGLSLIATSSKTMSVVANSQTVDGTEYTYALSLGGQRLYIIPCSEGSCIRNGHNQGSIEEYR